MRIWGLLCWWNEPEDWLYKCVHSAGKVVDHLVAVDGAFAGFPHDYALSDWGQHTAIRKAAHDAGITVGIWAPLRSWQGNEREKRNFMFDLATKDPNPPAWLMVIDADMVVRRAQDVREALEVTDLDCGMSVLNERAKTFRWKNFYRAIPGLHVGENHSLYKTPDGRYLWNGVVGPQEPGALLGVEIDHKRIRSEQRYRDQETYWEKRGESPNPAAYDPPDRLHSA